ncbi:MAG TPA: hypothetical protein VD927_02370 [Chryseosolibacter sp.]|nr:hypothetical protein [Chryseosolibacter sp.]
MKQRQVQDENNLIWDCVEALSGLSPEMVDKTKRMESTDASVTVVCTPSGGAQTVRLAVSPDWLEKLPDEKFLEKIKRERN